MGYDWNVGEQCLDRSEADIGGLEVPDHMAIICLTIDRIHSWSVVEPYPSEKYESIGITIANSKPPTSYS